MAFCNIAFIAITNLGDATLLVAQPGGEFPVLRKVVARVLRHQLVAHFPHGKCLHVFHRGNGLGSREIHSGCLEHPLDGWDTELLAAAEDPCHGRHFANRTCALDDGGGDLLGAGQGAHAYELARQPVNGAQKPRNGVRISIRDAHRDGHRLRARYHGQSCARASIYAAIARQAFALLHSRLLLHNANRRGGAHFLAELVTDAPVFIDLGKVLHNLHCHAPS